MDEENPMRIPCWYSLTGGRCSETAGAAALWSSGDPKRCWTGRKTATWRVVLTCEMDGWCIKSNLIDVF